jgi:predicted DNA-binding protein (MmcQ/YjbR family)
MTVDELVAYCLAKPGAEETFPWGDAELVAKVSGKAFAFIGLEGGQASLKAGDLAGEWCSRYDGVVVPSAYIGRYCWISVPAGGAVPEDEVRELVDASYADYVSRLPRKRRPGVDDHADSPSA